jgi:ABC-type Fe2+-enterobactin transport system substrate-binding protein
MTMHTTPDRDTTTAHKPKRISRMIPLAFGLALAVASPIIAAQNAGAVRAHGPAQPNGAAVQQNAAPLQQSGAAPQQSVAPAQQNGAALAPVAKTEIKNQAAYERLLNNSGVSVQWLWSADRGHLTAKDENDVVRIDGTQANFEGTLKIKGEIVSIDSDRFVFRGTILILDAPDKGRRCERTGDYEFRATGKRKYWRLQQMESCGRLTDYVDIYY